MVPDRVPFVENHAEKVVAKQFTELILKLLGPLLFIQLQSGNSFKGLLRWVRIGDLVVTRKAEWSAGNALHGFGLTGTYMISALFHIHGGSFCLAL